MLKALRSWKSSREENAEVVDLLSVSNNYD